MKVNEVKSNLEFEVQMSLAELYFVATVFGRLNRGDAVSILEEIDNGIRSRSAPYIGKTTPSREDLERVKLEFIYNELTRAIEVA